RSGKKIPRLWAYRFDSGLGHQSSKKPLLWFTVSGFFLCGRIRTHDHTRGNLLSGIRVVTMDLTFTRGGVFMIRSPKALLSAAVLAAGFVAAPAMAQTAATGQSPQSAQTAPAVQPTDAQLQSFIKASKNISAVVQEYQPKVQAAPDEAAREQV